MAQASENRWGTQPAEPKEANWDFQPVIDTPYVFTKTYVKAFLAAVQYIVDGIYQLDPNFIGTLPWYKKWKTHLDTLQNDKLSKKSWKDLGVQLKLSEADNFKILNGHPDRFPIHGTLPQI